MGGKISNDISESTQQIHSKTFMPTPSKGLYQTRPKNCKNSNFGFCHFASIHM